MFDIQSPARLAASRCRLRLAGPFAATQLASSARGDQGRLRAVGDATRRFGTMTECGDSLPGCRSPQQEVHNAGLRKPDGVRSGIKGVW